jgi:hypothetical protein
MYAFFTANMTELAENMFLPQCTASYFATGWHFMFNGDETARQGGTHL